MSLHGDGWKNDILMSNFSVGLSRSAVKLTGHVIVFLVVFLSTVDDYNYDYDSVVIGARRRDP